MNDYTPISCSFYDELEALATIKELVVIEYYADNNPLKISGKITNLYTKQKEEFVELNNDIIIRLDKLIAVNGKVPKNFC